MEPRPTSPRPPNGLHHITQPRPPSFLRGLDILDVLEHDSRPTFAVHTEHRDCQDNDGLVLAYWNPAMATATCQSLLVALLDTTGAEASTNTELYGDLQDFRDWISGTDFSEYFVFAGFTWATTELVERNAVLVSGVPSHASTTTSSRKSSKARTQTFDWTDAVPPSNLSPHIAWARSIDWANTSLGPMSLWPSQLRSFANLVLSDPRP